MKKRESGITLLTLVITIIVMIILAGIALKSAIGENGIIGQTSNTVDKYTNASDQEQEGLNDFVDDFNEIINGGGTGDGGSGDEDITITDKPTISIANWNTTGGIVEISTQLGYTTQYRIGKTGAWKEYTGQVNVDNGDTIYARYSSNEGVSQTVSKIVEDTNGPEVTIANLTVNGKEITITATAQDNEMGMPTPPTYNYYIKPHSETYYESVGHNTTGEYTFTNLQGNTSYDIRVSTTDLAGNQGSATTNSQTGNTVEIPDLVAGSNIYFDLNPSTPTKGNVNVTIRVPGIEEPLYIEYSKDGSKWDRYTNPVEMTDNGRVYARVTDGTETSNVVYVDVTNIDRTKPDVNVDVQYPTGSDSITVVVTPNDPSDPDNNNFKYDYYIKEKGQGDDEYKKDEGTDKTHTFDELDQNKSYDIKVEVTDPAGNKTVIEIPGVTTGEVPSGIEDGNIEITSAPTTPTKNNVTVTIKDNLNEGYDIEYSITKDGQEGQSQKYTGPFEVSENCIIKAWFTDGTNAGDAASLEIANIDKEAPVVSGNPETDENKVKERNVTVTITDKGTAGFNANQGINYKWTEENSGVPEGLSSLPGTNGDEARELSFTVPSESNLTGTYYLYVGPVTDKAGNSSEAKFFGPYEFDNEAPIPTFGPNGSTEYEKHYDVTLTFPEDEKDEVTNIEYEWTQGKDTEPTFQDGTTVEVDETIPSPDGVTGDDWYLNVKVTDENGNEEIVQVGPFYIDNSGPNISSSEGDYTTPKQSHTVTVNVEDPNSGLKEDMPKYVWVNGGSTPTEDTLKGGTTFTTGQEITTPEGETGDNWHLWIYAEDELGNVTKKDIGPFNLDNTAPTVTFSPDGNTSSWSKEYEVTVNPTDANSNINESTLKYQWTQGNTKPETIATEGTPFKPGDKIKSPDGVTGNDWYLWIYVEDNAGNPSIVGTKNPFYIDNTAPTLELSPVAVSGSEASSTIKVQVNATDKHSQINDSSYKYYIKEKDGEYTETGNVSVSGSTLTFKNLKADTEYTIKVEVTDNAGNTTYKEITITTGSVAGGDTIITHQLIPDTWTNGSVSLNLSLADGYDGYKIQYKLQSGTWTDYAEAVQITSNQTVQVRPLDTSNNPGGESSVEISNIDTVKPTISAEPSTDTTPAQTKKITITVADTNTDSNIAGFTAGKTIRYGWSTSNSQEPTYDQTASSTNGLGETTATFEVTTPNYTGSYYLWIQAGSISDRAGNSNEVAHFGPYTLDNEGPSINFSSDDDREIYKKEHSVTVNAGDATVKKYVWTQSQEEPDKSQFTGTFNNDEPIIKNSGSGDWYLWIYVEDSLGNSTTECSEVYKFDNTAPDVTFGTQGNDTPSKNQSTIVNIANDGYSNIDSNSLKYIWSTSESEITESSFDGVEDTFTNGESITNKTPLDGNYYLWILAKDEAGNTTVKRTDGTFNFDNTIPTVTFTPTQNTNPAKSQSVNVKVEDTNLNASSLKYVWTETNSKPQSSSITNPFNNGENITISEGSGDRYLWILGYDTAGNEVITGAGPFLLDNTPPTVSLDYKGTTSSITVNVDAKDDHSGIASYSYTIQEVGGSYTQTVTDGASHTFSSLKQNTKYTVTVTVTDNSGNTTTRTTEEITTAGIPEGNTAINIGLEPSAWTNGEVTVTITKNVENADNLHIEYKIGTSGSYTTYDKSFTVSENTTIYAKLVDDAGNEGSIATADIAYIDNQAPTITPDPASDSTYSKTKTVTIKAEDKNYDESVAGFKANQSLKYAWSESSTQAPTRFETLTGTNEAGAKSISFKVNGSDYTGTYYLWIQAGSLEDQASNTSAVTHFGPYNFDNTPPTLGGDGQITVTEATSKSISISVPGVVDTEGTVASPQYTYYIKKTSEQTYTQDGEATTTATHTFSNLDDNTSYDIKVTFTDNAGNTGEATVTKQTELVPTLNGDNTTFTLSTEKWTNKAITVEISTTEQGYTLQYSTDGSTYQTYSGPVTVSSNLTVYARLWDERNSIENVGTATTKEITNIDTSLSDLGVIVKNEEPVTENTQTTDKDGNTITIPEGFTPQPNTDTDDPYNPTVDDGVIVKDQNGNEFVWIPVGTINTDSGTKTINYNRYIYANWVNGGTDSDTNSMKIQTTSNSSEYFVESLNESEKTSAETNKGFYLGRYEAGVSTGVRTESSGTSSKVEIKPGKDVYNYVTQSEARSLAENMYSSDSFTSNLTSSYAWDTALKFLEQTGNSSYLTNSNQGNYYNTQYGGKTQSNASALIETGETQAVKHLYDMGGNVYEWTTERYSSPEATKVSRGGFYGFTSTDEPVIGRFSSSNTKDQAVGFRVALFLGAVDSAPKYMDDLQVGDYVAYKPDTAEDYTLYDAYSGYTDDDSDTQTIKQEDLKWRVLSINDDGTVDLISANPTSKKIYFQGALGYNNGVYLLNDISAKLYSNSSLGATARSLNIEDIEKHMTEAGLNYIHEYSSSAGVAYGKTKTYTSHKYYPNLYEYENGSGINGAEVKKDGIEQSESYYSSPTTETYSQADSNGLTVTQKYYESSMNSSYYDNSTFYNLIHKAGGGSYWLASRYVDAYTSIGAVFAIFGLRRVNISDLNDISLFYSNSSYGKNALSLRHVVSLKSNIKLGSGDGKSSSTAYEIIN